MANKFHKDLTDLNIHALTAATYADIAARDADTAFQVAANINKVVRVDSPLSYYILVSVGPAVWSEFGSVDTLASVLVHGNITGGTDLIVSSGDDLLVDGGMTVGSQDTPATDSSMDLTADDKAFLVNRLSTAQRDALTPLEGMEIFNTDTKLKEVYTGTSWMNSVASGDVNGPTGALDNEVVRFDSTTGKLIKNGSDVFITNAGDLGVGTATPDEKVDVVSSDSDGARVQTKATGTGGDNLPGFQMNNEGTVEGGLFYSETNDAVELWNDTERVLWYGPGADPDVYINGELVKTTTGTSAFGFVNGNATTTTIVSSNTYQAMDVSGFASVGIRTSGWTVTNATNGVWTYNGPYDFDGLVKAMVTAVKTASTMVYRFAVSVDGAIPTYATAHHAPLAVLATYRSSVMLMCPISVSNGQTVQVMVAGEGTSNNLTITDLSMDIAE